MKRDITKKNDETPLLVGQSGAPDQQDGTQTAMSWEQWRAKEARRQVDTSCAGHADSS